MKLLFDEWERDPFHDFSTFMRDGIIDHSEWKTQTPRVLLFNKEGYTKGAGKFDLRDELRESAPYRNWNRVSNWLFALREIVKSGKAPNMPDLSWEDGNKLLRGIAAVNVKKSNGETLSDYTNLEEYLHHDKLRLKEQIDLIAPDIVICGNIFNYYKYLYNRTGFKKLETKYCFSHGDRLVIDFWHFANRKDQLEVYDEFCEVIVGIRSFIRKLPSEKE